MRFIAIIREAGRDITSGTARTALTCLLYTVLLSLLAAHEFSSVTALLDAAAKFQAAGSNVRIISAPERIDGNACASLKDLYGVDSAAIRTVPGQLRATTMSTVPLAQFAATPGIGDVLGARSAKGTPIARAGALVGEPVLEQFGKGASEIPTDHGKLTIAGTYPYTEDGRRGGLGFAVIYPEIAGAQPYDECWIRAWPEHPDTNALLNSTVLPATKLDESTPEITQLNTTLGRSFEGREQFEDRISRFDPLIAVASGGAIGFFAVRLRRLELASARHAGVSASALVLLQLLQQTAWILLGGGLVLAGSITAAGYYPDAAGSLWEITARTILLGSLGAFASVAVATASIRERALFAYFKQRE